VALILQNIFAFPPGVPLADSDIRITCYNCETPQTLDQASADVEDGDTVYRCEKCKELLVAVVVNGVDKWSSFAYPFAGDLSIHNRVDLFIKMHDGKRTMRLGGSPDAYLPLPLSE